MRSMESAEHSINQSMSMTAEEASSETPRKVLTTQSKMIPAKESQMLKFFTLLILFRRHAG